MSFCSLFSHVATAMLVLCKQSDFVDDIASKNPSDNSSQNLHHINLDKLLNILTFGGTFSLTNTMQLTAYIFQYLTGLFSSFHSQLAIRVKTYRQIHIYVNFLSLMSSRNKLRQ